MLRMFALPRPRVSPCYFPMAAKSANQNASPPKVYLYSCIQVNVKQNPGAVHAASRVFRFCPMIFLLNDRPGGARTHDLMIKSHLLCQLSYGPEHRRYSNTKTKAVAIENSRSSTVFFWFFVCVSGITLPIPPSPIMGMLAKAKFF